MKHPFEPLSYTPRSVESMIRDSHDFYQRMKTRRSVRNFSDRDIPREVIENCLKTAGSAPSGANRQPWHFVVVTDPKVKQEIRKAAENEEQEFYDHRAPPQWLHDLAPIGTNDQKPFLEIAPVLIAIFQQKYVPDEDGNKHTNYYSAESVGIATGMLITALHMSGLASLTHTPSPMKFLNRILKRPQNEKPFLLLVVGYPSDNAQVPVLKKLPLEKIATFVNPSAKTDE